MTTKEARQLAERFKEWYIYAKKERLKTIKSRKTYADKYEYLSEMIEAADKAIDRNEQLKYIIKFTDMDDATILTVQPYLQALIKRLLKIEDEHYEHNDIDKERVL